MAKNFLTSYLLLFLYVSDGLGSHFRGAIFMVRPSASGVNNEVNARSFIDCKILFDLSELEESIQTYKQK